jgi:hypothetical protein
MDESCFAAVFLRPFSVSGMERSVVYEIIYTFKTITTEFGGNET